MNVAAWGGDWHAGHFWEVLWGSNTAEEKEREQNWAEKEAGLQGSFQGQPRQSPGTSEGGLPPSNGMSCPGLSAPSPVSHWMELPRKEASSETTWKRLTGTQAAAAGAPDLQPRKRRREASSHPPERANRKGPFGAHLFIQNSFLASI